MKSSHHIDNPDVILIGSGIMSSNLGAMLKKLSPELKIQLYEVTEELSQESSNGWNNAGTGHAGICELSYTPTSNADGTVDVDKAIEIFHQFEHSKQFWGYAVRSGMVKDPKDFINPVPHISFVYGQEQVDFLKARYKAMSSHHFFKDMEYTEDRDVIRKWAPLLLAGRDNTPVAATKMDRGTDVNFGEIARKLIRWLGEQSGCGYATNHRVTDLKRTSSGWEVTILDAKDNRTFKNNAKFVFIGAGGGSLPLLQKSGIAESKGFGGFPIGGQWLICDKPEVVEQHEAKVYGMSPGAAPTMAVPHLDTRIIDGKKALLFGPYAAWTTKFLHKGGKVTDLPGSIRPDNILSLMKVGMHNIPLVRYLIQQGTQSMNDRMKELHNFYPDAKTDDWKLIDAGIRVQAIKKEDGDAGIVHFGTEVVTDADRSISALLGASPGASVSVNIVLEVILKCFSHLLASQDGKDRMKAMLPTYDEDLVDPSMAERQHTVSEEAVKSLQLI
ncbi:malate dehydrogenase (quinone) [Rubellicoccus peritrichatus]|uniref:Probable malate:quinone oxidoreductase n=1 Tax=Rubellicoccus peritrichatus TaxID=3080537 RepID=A0AAQ3QS01_9BACT|nr:malate dehydrogenase (quinone) [Puniceicoccus sp. CR14]WOO39826.1 malate dehydrogenase (quinone) [Puniceicoccus sp. CR14]